MKKKQISPNPDFAKIEEKILSFWQKEKIFEKSQEKRKKAKKFTFYDGPPFATGLPHYGHILAMAIKDAVCRYKTMQGFYVPRRLGWDCHGLPVEYEVEKELGIKSKKEIEELGIEKFCQKARVIVFRYTKDWLKTIDRMGRWADKENTYATLDKEYIESVWWVFREIWDKGLVYQGFKSMPYCPRCATPLSNFETNQGYRDNVPDPSLYIKFKLKNQNAFLLVWTTTPWTLPGNVALAVKGDAKYVQIRENSELLILCKERQKVLFPDSKVEREYLGQELVGKTYEPLYNFLETPGYSHQIFDASFVSLEDGTGIVHIAPAFGEEDLELGQEKGVPVLQTVNERGEFIDKVAPWRGEFVKDADCKIIADLEKRGLVFKTETIYHTYPFCWRCETPLIFYAMPTWFIKVSSIKDKLIKNNKKIDWVPKHIGQGRFGKWLEEARDWAVSRNRFWGAPVPIWRCEDCNQETCIGSLFELKEKAKNPEKIGDLHRPYIDEVILRCPCGQDAKRIPEVLDCWFESGSMPYAQDHYPFERKEEFDKNFPADFIAEGLDQTRGWFYTLHVIATILFDNPAFLNCIVNGLILDPQGQKLSKRLRNYPEPEEVFAGQGADALRWLLLSSPASKGEALLFSSQRVTDIVRRLLLPFWNVYVFFITYSTIDSWSKKSSADKNLTILDRWISARLEQLIFETTRDFDAYDLPSGLSKIEDLVSDLSSWYIRRSRDRAGPTVENKRDKNIFYATLHRVLVQLCQILAPFAPFVAEEIFRDLTEKDSVHLSNWPTVPEGFKVDNLLLRKMEEVRKICELGHAKRKKANIKVRQPLNVLIYSGNKLGKDLEKIIAGEVNVKMIKNKKTQKNPIMLDTKITQELKAEGKAREIVRIIQEKRKEQKMAFDDKIEVALPDWPKEFENYIKSKTLAQRLKKEEKISIKVVSG
ncbi:hypothetical protein A2Z23_00505 [Candidatus Curtissbacteria bacterium RBG_16_39_7]|uniref:Isoleucine--tRNA ligase n=1 Tax=Candidatus Curtissbacteria bacterium RBG_16_39_7 TaxID=1797707 RepID=A0A1F5G2M3_9BACT|nr:MAG: hypothetical protein A2Z23_00505 [Candidatus Curtissbacteria bacterium RBG_16_39_7]